MRIGIVAPEFPPEIGGIETYVYEFVRELARLLVLVDFGMLVTIQVFTGPVGFFAGGGLGLGPALVREAVEELDCRVVFTRQLAIDTAVYATPFRRESFRYSAL
jgi:hypothetical protein